MLGSRTMFSVFQCFALFSVVFAVNAVPTNNRHSTVLAPTDGNVCFVLHSFFRFSFHVCQCWFVWFCESLCGCVCLSLCQWSPYDVPGFSSFARLHLVPVTAATPQRNRHNVVADAVLTFLEQAQGQGQGGRRAGAFRFLRTRAAVGAATRAGAAGGAAAGVSAGVGSDDLPGTEHFDPQSGTMFVFV